MGKFFRSIYTTLQYETSGKLVSEVYTIFFSLSYTLRLRVNPHHGVLTSMLFTTVWIFLFFFKGLYSLFMLRIFYHIDTYWWCILLWKVWWDSNDDRELEYERFWFEMKYKLVVCLNPYFANISVIISDKLLVSQLHIRDHIFFSH